MKDFCGAKTRSGKKCRKAPMRNGRCNLHGGKSPIGIGSPNIKHGRYSKDLPTRMSSRFEEALADADLVQLGRDIALIDSRLGEVLSEITQDSTGTIFGSLRRAFNDYTKSNDPAKKQVAFVEMEFLIEQGAEDWQKWQEVYSVLEQRRKMVESEAKRQVQLQQTLTTSQAVNMLAAVIDTVKRHVTDVDALRAISADIAGLAASQTVGRT